MARSSAFVERNRPSSPVNGPADARADVESWCLFRDAHVLVLNKPAGLSTHAGPSAGPSLEPWLDSLRYGFVRRPQPAHRLDHDTAGCLVLGRHPRALTRLGRLFADGLVGKTYWAVVRDGPNAERGTIDLPLAKQNRRDGWWMAVDPRAGKPAATEWTVLSRRGGLALLALRPRTGRTHQVRAHAAAFGWPILGDPIYGKDGDRPDMPLHLLARTVEIPYSVSGPSLSITAPVPPHMRAQVTNLGVGIPEMEASGRDFGAVST